MRSLIHLLKFTMGLDTPASQVTDRELKLLMSYSRNARVICELGCYEGRTSVAFALNTTGMVYSVDPFFAGRLGVCSTGCIARLHRWRSEARNLVFLRGLSLNVAPTFHLPVNFLFVDADHSYQAAKADWNAWAPKVTEDGYIALHDSKLAVNSPELLGSMRFYSEDLARMPDVIECASVDSLVILQTRSRSNSSVDRSECIEGSSERTQGSRS